MPASARKISVSRKKGSPEECSGMAKAFLGGQQIDQRISVEHQADVGWLSMHGQRIVNEVSANLTAVSSEYSFADRIIDVILMWSNLIGALQSFCYRTHRFPHR